MDRPAYCLTDLFAQLGLPGDEAGMARFLAAHRPLDPHTELADAPFWSPAQADFLREEILEDASWALVVDELNLLLRAPAAGSP